MDKIKFKIGDLVRIVGVSNREPSNGWVPSMSRYIGKTARVTKINEENPALRYYAVEHTNDYWFIESALEPVSVDLTTRIEVGKFYRTREGGKARIYSTDSGPNACASIHGAILKSGIWLQRGWDNRGRIAGTEDQEDIIGIWVEPHPAEFWPVDAKILVRDDSDGENEWVTRHFARFAGGRVQAWSDGKTSFTAENAHDTVSWDEAKLAD